MSCILTKIENTFLTLLLQNTNLFCCTTGVWMWKLKYLVNIIGNETATYMHTKISCSTLIEANRANPTTEPTTNRQTSNKINQSTEPTTNLQTSNNNQNQFKRSTARVQVFKRILTDRQPTFTLFPRPIITNIGIWFVSIVRTTSKFRKLCL